MSRDFSSTAGVVPMLSPSVEVVATSFCLGRRVNRGAGGGGTLEEEYGSGGSDAGEATKMMATEIEERCNAALATDKLSP